MFWALLASTIMLLSGDGDDRVFFTTLNETMESAVKQYVQDADRQKLALEAVRGFSTTFKNHRENLKKFNTCVVDLDRTYKVTIEQYQACRGGLDAVWQVTEDEMIRYSAMQAKAVTPEEAKKIETKILEEFQ